MLAFAPPLTCSTASQASTNRKPAAPCQNTWKTPMNPDPPTPLTRNCLRLSASLGRGENSKRPLRSTLGCEGLATSRLTSFTSML